ncbi:MAG: aldo/keto reductase [Verrucomicrobia bacterium]|nr:aldo/keto reductase [Verrucomicrobiota bacterium]
MIPHPHLSSFTLDPDAVDPDSVPFRTLASGARIPAIGLGTFGSDHVSGAEIARAIQVAARLGYRHFDCAAVYGNEHLIGESLHGLQHDGLRREDLWITSKLWNNSHAPGEVIPACERSLRDLQLEFLDLYLIHWPFPNYHPPGCDAASRAPDAKPYLHDRFMETWGQLERLVASGKVRAIGASNMTVPKLSLLWRDARVRPACNEMELHPHFQQPELFEFVMRNGIIPIGYCPLGSPGRPDRDRTPNDSVPMEDPVIVELAGRYGVHPATICLKWAVQRGQIPIPFSVRRENLVANIRAVVSAPLSHSEMDQIAGIDRNCRLIKGHVFLWKENQSWEDLWDPGGVITPS